VDFKESFIFLVKLLGKRSFLQCYKDGFDQPISQFWSCFIIHCNFQLTMTRRVHLMIDEIFKTIWIKWYFATLNQFMNLWICIWYDALYSINCIDIWVSFQMPCIIYGTMVYNMPWYITWFCISWYLMTLMTYQIHQ
jgi:hypothetical protein